MPTVLQLQARATGGLWSLAAFVALSLWARTDFRYLPSAPDSWGRVLGRPPPPELISAALVLYLFSAMVLALTRMATDRVPARGWTHVGYLAAFYGFYHVSGALADNYWAVLVGGAVVLTLECYRNWLYWRQRLEELESSGRTEPEE